MKKKSYAGLSISVIIIVALALYFLWGINAQQNNNKRLSLLKLTRVIPNPSDSIFFQRPINMTFDGKGHFYISDQAASSVYKFDNEGNFIFELARQGRGPGELGNASTVRYDKGVVAVDNETQLQFYDDGGNFIDSFFIFGFENYLFRNNKIYVFKFLDDIRSLMNSKKKLDRSLIQVYNRKGKQIGQFGELILNLIPTDNNLAQVFGSSILFSIYDGKLYCLFEYYPVLRIYDLKTQSFLNEIKFERPFNYADRVLGNYDPKSFSKPNVVGVTSLFKAIDVNSSGIFLGLYDDNILIDHYDLEGNFIQRYKRGFKTEPYYLYDMKVFDNDEKLTFYLLVKKEGTPLLCIYTPN